MKRGSSGVRRLSFISPTGQMDDQLLQRDRCEFQAERFSLLVVMWVSIAYDGGRHQAA
jgi:hypothetical protein